LSSKLFRALVVQHRRRFLTAGGLKLLHDLLMLAGPFLLQRLLQHEQAGGGKLRGAGLALAMFACAMAQTLCINSYFHILFRIGMHVKSGVIGLVYRKALRVSSSALADMGTGKVQNLQSNDASKIWGLPTYLHVIWSAPLQIVIIMIMLTRLLHVVPALAGLGVTIVMVPMGAVLGKKLARLRKELVKRTDERIKCVSEVLSGIKAIKLYAWEGPFKEKLLGLREEELVWVRQTLMFSLLNSVIYFSGPILVSLASFSAYSLMGYSLTADIAFPALALFNLLRFPILILPMQVQNIINGKVSLKRLQDYLDAEDKEAPPAAEMAPGEAVRVEKADFKWGAGAVGGGARARPRSRHYETCRSRSRRVSSWWSWAR